MSPFEIIPFIVILSFSSRSKQCVELDLAISWNQETNDNMQAILSTALSTKQEKLWQATWLSYILQPLGTRRCYGGSSSLFLSSQVYRAVFFTRARATPHWLAWLWYSALTHFVWYSGLQRDKLFDNIVVISITVAERTKVLKHSQLMSGLVVPTWLLPKVTI